MLDSPNPFDPILHISYGIKTDADVMLRIYNQRGQLGHARALGSKAAGTHGYTWNGKNQSGDACGSGVYLLRLRIGNEDYQRKVSLLK